MVAVVIPGDFAAKVQAAKPVKIQILGDGSDANTSRLAMNYAAMIGAIYARTVTSEQHAAARAGASSNGRSN